MGGDYRFRGFYDGNGHTINVNITSSGDNCVFPRLENAVIMNVGITGSITGNSFVAGIARTTLSNSTAKIVNCWSTAALTGADASGITSTLNSSTRINNCLFAGKMYATRNGPVSYNSVGSMSSINNIYFYNANNAAITPDLNANKGIKVLTENELKSTAAGLLNSGLQGALAVLGSEYTIDDLLLWYQSGEDDYPSFTIEEKISVRFEQNHFKTLSGSELQLSAFVDGAVTPEGRKLTWSCDEGSGKVTVNQSGLVTIAENAPSGRVTVTATSQADPLKSASVVIDVVRKTVMTGAGTKESPYIIADESNFLTFTNDILLAGKNAVPNKYDGKYIKQTVDIDMTDVSGYSGMGGDYRFRGVYDGNGHTINVNINSTGDNCIFPRLESAVIMNVGTTGSITGNSFIAGIARTTQSGSVSKIVNCWSTMTLNGAAEASGITSTLNTTKINNCLFAGALYGTRKGPVAYSSVGSISSVNNIYFYNANNAEITFDLSANKGVKVLTEAELKSTAAALLNDGREAALAVLGDGYTIQDLAVWDQGGANGYPSFTDTDLYKIKKINIAGTKIESVTVKAEKPEEVVLYIAVFTGEQLDRVLKCNVASAGESNIPVDLEISDGATVKGFLWKTNMQPMDFLKKVVSINASV